MDILSVKEQIYLIAILNLKENAYGLKIREKIIEMTGKEMVFGTLYNNLDSLVKKNYVLAARSEDNNYIGGNKRVFYSLTDDGIATLVKARELQNSMWESIPANILPGPN